MEYIKIKNLDIPINIKNVGNSKSINMYIRENILVVTKPKYISKKRAFDVVVENSEKIYDKCIKEDMNFELSKWINGGIFYIFGDILNIEINNVNTNKVRAKIEDNKLIINVNYELSLSDRIDDIRKAIKKLLKKVLEPVIYERLKYWSNFTKIEYDKVSIKYMTSRWGSCLNRSRSLNFSSKLAMLPINVIDSVIVHELCHIKEPNHSDKFWKLVYSFYPQYDESSNYIKDNREDFVI